MVGFYLSIRFDQRGRQYGKSEAYSIRRDQLAKGPV